MFSTSKPLIEALAAQLETVQIELGDLVAVRETWTPHMARHYAELCARERALLDRVAA